MFSAIVTGVAQNEKTAQNHGGVVPAVWHNDVQSKGALIFSEDFSFGIPGTWTNVTASGPVDWKHTTVGHTGDYPTAAIQSTTSSNGWVLVDSDADNFSGGGAEDAQLTTPVINCSGYTNVKVEFQQMFRRWQQDITTVRVTTDGGTTYTDFEINQAITQTGTDNPDFVNIDITSAIAGDPTNVQIQFWWQGAWDYGWQIDDVAIKEIDPNDIIIKKTSLSEDVTYYKVPQAQVQPLLFNAFAENIGYIDQTNVVLDIDVNDGSGSVFTGSSAALSLLAVGATDSLAATATYSPVAIGTYDVDFGVTQTEADDELTNNNSNISLEVTDTIYAIDNGNYGGQWWNLEDTPGSSAPFEIGAVYEVVADDYATTASVYIGDNSTVGVVFEIGLYVFNAGTSEYDNILFSQTYTVDAADLGNWKTVSLGSEELLTAGNDYLLSVLHYGGPDALYVGYSTNSSFSGATLSNDGNGAAWANQPRTPMLRMNLGEVGLSVDENEPSFSIYPNPAFNQITIDAKGDDIISIEVTDIAGRFVGTYSRVNTIDVSDFVSGSYFLTVRTTKNVSTQKIQVK